MIRLRSYVTLALLFSLASPVWSQQTADPQAGKISKASDEPLKSLKRMQVPNALTAELWAAEPLVANPVAFCFDEKGRIYVAETFRLHRGVTDNRGNMKWLDDELANRTVAERVAM